MGAVLGVWIDMPIWIPLRFLWNLLHGRRWKEAHYQEIPATPGYRLSGGGLQKISRRLAWKKYLTWAWQDASQGIWWRRTRRRMREEQVHDGA